MCDSESTMIAELKSVKTDSHSMRERPWYRLQATTLFALLLVGAATLGRQMSGRDGVHFGTNLLSEYQLFCYGWPMECLDRMLMIDLASGSITQVDWQWDWGPLLLDIAISIALLFSTALVCETWRRRNFAPWQFSLRSIFVVMAVMAIVGVTYTSDVTIPWHWPNGEDNRWHFVCCGLAVSPWYIIAPMLFGIGCAIYVMAAATWSLGSTMLRLARSARATNRARGRSDLRPVVDDPKSKAGF
jgi:hypothetical protein